MKRRIGLAAIAFFGLLLTAQATGLDPDAVAEAIARFKQTPEARLAPKGVQKAEALLGAAMLAEQQGDTAKAEEALKQAVRALSDAEATARQFRQHFPELLAMLRDAEGIADAFRQYGNGRDEAIDAAGLALIAKGFSEVVAAFERGQMGTAQQLAGKLQAKLQAWLDAAAVPFSRLAERLLEMAARAGAKRYAVNTYAAAKQKWLAVQAWAEQQGKRPQRPFDAARLAAAARRIAEEARAWRKDRNAYEELRNRERKARLRLAEALGIPYSKEDPLVDVELGRILARIDDLQKALARARKQRHELAEQEKRLCEQKIARLTEAAEEQCGEKIAKIKDAYRAKLAQERLRLQREAEPVRRFRKLQALFSPQEAEIYQQPDGSVLIRLKGLRFKSGSTWIDPAGRKLVEKLKQALALYPNRRVRVEGHTDNRGDARLNQRLSLARAQEVVKLLVSLGVDARRLVAYGYGEARPIASNDDPRGRAMNRRIDVVIEAQ